MPGEGRVDVVRVRIVEAGADHRGLEIVVAYDLEHAPEVEEGVLVAAQEGLELLVPDRLLVAVTRAAQASSGRPRADATGPSRSEGRGTPEEVDLAFFSRSAVVDAYRAATVGRGCGRSA